MTTTFFVTGANRGIGFQIVKKLLQTPEYKVIATVRDKTKTNLLSINSPNLHIIDVEFTDSYENIKKSVDTIGSAFPNGVDVVIHNAGIYPDEPTEEIDLDDLAKNLDVNLLGSAKIYNAIKPYWLKKDNGVQKRFWFFSTVLALTTFEYPWRPFGYGTSKAALTYLTNALATKATIAPEPKLFHESLIACIHPGLVATDMLIGRVPEEVERTAITPETSAADVLNVILNSKPEYHGHLVSHEGKVLL